MNQSERTKHELNKIEFAIVKAKRHFAYRFFYVGLEMIGYDYRGRGQCWGIPKCLQNTDYKSGDIHAVYVYNCD